MNCKKGDKMRFLFNGFKNKFLFFMVFGILTSNGFSQMISEKEKNYFNSGALMDFTPKEISVNNVLVGSEGPFVFVVGIKRDGNIVDTRPMDKVEKIKFSVLKGSGKFAVMQKPDKLTDNELVINPSRRGVLTVLFFPAADGDYSLKVTTIGNPGIKGEIDYNFKVYPYSKDEFYQIGLKNLEKENTRNRYPHGEIIQSSTKNYSEDGTKAINEEAKSKYFLKKKDGTFEVRENDESGKVLSLKKSSEINEKFMPFNHGKVWGATQDDIIYLDQNGSSELILSYHFYNKKNANQDQTVILSADFITVHTYEYRDVGGNELLGTQESEVRNIFGSKISSETITHIYK
jgi:hypothetical protein